MKRTKTPLVLATFCTTLLLSTQLSAEVKLPEMEPKSVLVPQHDHAKSSEQGSPDVTIIRMKDRKIEEFRVNGQLYMLKVTPDVGVAYYLVDTDGDGQLESHDTGGVQTPSVPQWVLIQW